MKEKDEVLGALKERAELVHKTLSSFEGYKVNPVQGAMYVFPRIEIPPKAIAAAKEKNMPPDVFYAHELLESTGMYIEFYNLNKILNSTIYYNGIFTIFYLKLL